MPARPASCRGQERAHGLKMTLSFMGPKGALGGGGLSEAMRWDELSPHRYVSASREKGPPLRILS
jgi:hypothetical protein